MTANVNSETGVRYGVIDARNVPWLHEAIVEKGVNETWKGFKDDALETIKNVLTGIVGVQEGHLSKERGERLNDIAESVFDDVDEIFPDQYSGEEEYSYEDEDGNRFLLGWLGGAPLIWCIKTDRLLRAKVCSPCVPNAGDLNNTMAPDEDGGVECYAVPLRYLGGVEETGDDDSDRTEEASASGS